MMTLPARPLASPARRDYHPCAGCGAEMTATLTEAGTLVDDLCPACWAAIAPPRISRTPLEVRWSMERLEQASCPACTAADVLAVKCASDRRAGHKVTRAAGIVALWTPHAPGCPRHRPAAGMEDGE